MIKVAVCIPTFNEADTISHTTRIVDRGLEKLFKKGSCVIVNSDNASSDGTGEKFLATKTSCQKIYLSTSPGEKGKGRNLINFFNWAQKENVFYVATIDADIASLNERWPLLLLKPLLKKKANFVTPLYKRSRFEAAITNQLAFPLVFGFFGIPIRQPIGGDFALSKDFYSFLLKQKKNEEILGYGIDIFMTCHALGKKEKIEQVFLGEKIHKPSFPKLVLMFQEVFVSFLTVLPAYFPFSLGKTKPLKTQNLKMGIIKKRGFPHKKETIEMRKEWKNIFLEREKDYQKIFPSLEKEGSFQKIKEKIKRGLFNITKEEWTDLMANFLAEFFERRPNYSTIKKMASLIAPLFLWRAASFWFQAEKKSAKETEKEILDQAQLFREKIKQKLK